MRALRIIGLLGVIVVVGSGCVGVKKKTARVDVRTGMFGNNRIIFSETFDKIVRKKTTVKDLEALGFKLNAPNVASASDGNAFKVAFGPDFFKSAADGDPMGFLDKYTGFVLYQMPYRYVVTVSDRFYWSEKITTSTGYDDMYDLMIYQNIVVYSAPHKKYNDSSQVDKSFARGLLDIASEFGSSSISAITKF